MAYTHIYRNRNYICSVHQLHRLTKYDNTDYVIVRVYLSLVFTIKRPKGASEARAPGFLMVKTVNKYTLNSLVSDLFCDRQRM